MSLTQHSNTVEVKQRGQAPQFDNLRDQLAASVPSAVGMLLLATDGLARCAYGLPDGQDDTVAAASSGLASLGNGMAKALEGGHFKHLNLTLERYHVIATACGGGSVLVVVLPLDARLGDAVRETVRIASAFRLRMDTAPRAAAGS
ncbi:roadblock/LC7 domain-containing protein [Streptomyces sp. NBC_01433]|uniref:roadblock/LC7 domain-containing protein n=1 Tax=Streptomyces sp. NBC_01433 TaxID=2903864 RepID=UPI0022504286|nr:roadblock/LC7 domain-containing protein [Streptomyces sp. NBC_01433]MCX4682210.1 roadblock/LC7 domain-containing protein [Streptomyces sp. NBC_01433]